MRGSISRHCARNARGFTLLVLALVAPHTFAAPIILRDFAFVYNRPSDDIFGVTGLRLHLEVRATDAGGTAALTGAGAGARGTSSNAAFPISQPFTIPYDPVLPVTGGATFISNFRIAPSDFSRISGALTYTVTNTSGQSTSIQTHVLDKLEVIPLPTNLAVSNQSTTPTFTFTDPNPFPAIPNLARWYQAAILNDQHQIVSFLPNSQTPSFQVPANVLQAGQQYYLRAASVDLDLTEGIFGARPIENVAIGYLPFTPNMPQPPSSQQVAAVFGSFGNLIRKRDAWQAAYDKDIECASDQTGDPSCVGFGDGNATNAAAREAATAAREATLDAAPFVVTTTGVSSVTPTIGCDLVVCKIVKGIDLAKLGKTIYQNLLDVGQLFLGDNASTSQQRASIQFATLSDENAPSVLLTSMVATDSQLVIEGEEYSLVEARFTADILKPLVDVLRQGDEFAFDLELLDPAFGEGFGVGSILNIIDPPEYGSVEIGITFFAGAGLRAFAAVPEPPTIALLGLALIIGSLCGFRGQRKTPISDSASPMQADNAPLWIRHHDTQGRASYSGLT